MSPAEPPKREKRVLTSRDGISLVSSYPLTLVAVACTSKYMCKVHRFTVQQHCLHEKYEPTGPAGPYRQNRKVYNGCGKFNCKIVWNPELIQYILRAGVKNLLLGDMSANLAPPLLFRKLINTYMFASLECFSRRFIRCYGVTVRKGVNKLFFSGLMF